SRWPRTIWSTFPPACRTGCKPWVGRTGSMSCCRRRLGRGTVTALSDRTLIRSEFQRLRIAIRHVHEPQVRELDRAVALGGDGGMVRHPGEEGVPVLDGGGLVRRPNDVEPCRHTAVRPALGF